MGRNSGLTQVPTGDLVALLCQIDLLLTVEKANTSVATAKVERRLSTLLGKGWLKAARTATETPLDRLFSSPPTPPRIQTFLQEIGVILASPLTPAQIKITRGHLEAIWKEAKRLAAKEVGKGIKASFSLVDNAAITALNQHQVFWVGDFYSTHLSQRIAAVAEDVILRQGLSAKEAGKVLHTAMQREFGLVPGGRSKFAPKVPAQFAGDPARYFEDVASNSAHQARTFAKVTMFREAEVTVFRLVNPNDRRTGQICQQMHGQEFTVSAGVKQMNKILQTQDPKDVKAAAPWLSGEEITSTVGDSKPGSKEAAGKLSAAGVILPPFHPRCRTEPVVVS